MIAQGDTFRLSRPRVAHTQLFILSQTYSAHLTTPLPAETLGNHCTSYLIRDATRWKRISESQSTSYTLKDAELSCNDSIRVTSRSPTNQLAQESLSRCATRAITAILGTPRRRLYYTVTNRRRIRAWEITGNNWLLSPKPNLAFLSSLSILRLDVLFTPPRASNTKLT
jgi:hypothetical protein